MSFTPGIVEHIAGVMAASCDWAYCPPERKPCIFCTGEAKGLPARIACVWVKPYMTERRRAYNRAYYLAHREQWNARSRAWRAMMRQAREDGLH